MIVNNKNINCLEFSFSKYTYFPCRNNLLNTSIDYTYKCIVDNFIESIKKRVLGTCDRPIACLLSGGLDSSLVASIVNKLIKDNIKPNQVYKLKTFSIGLPNSEDLHYAKIVANHLESDHNEIVVSEDDLFNAIPEVIKTIESYDTTTIRASVGNYLVSKYIKENSDCKVIFNGDGADELMGGYLYFKKSPNAFEFDKECKRLLQDIHMFDVLRSDKSISSHGLEPRTPFLDRQWVEFYLSISRDLRYTTTINNCEKYLIRKAFSEIMPELLPENILWRTKEAFSDGVSKQTKSWFEIIQNHIKYNVYDHITEEVQENIINNMNPYKFNKPETLEQLHYREIFGKHFRSASCQRIIPYFWMPKYVKAKDASARSLNIYKEDNTNTSILKH